MSLMKRELLESVQEKYNLGGERLRLYSYTSKFGLTTCSSWAFSACSAQHARIALRVCSTLTTAIATAKRVFRGSDAPERTPQPRHSPSRPPYRSQLLLSFTALYAHFCMATWATLLLLPDSSSDCAAAAPAAPSDAVRDADDGSCTWRRPTCHVSVLLRGARTQAQLIPHLTTTPCARAAHERTCGSRESMIPASWAERLAARRAHLAAHGLSPLA